MPIDQMMVTITRPLEEAVNSVPGLQNVRSVTSRGSAEIDLFFDWNVDMFQTLQYVNAAVSRVQSELPATAKIRADRLTFASFPHHGVQLHCRQSGPNQTLGNGDVRNQAPLESTGWCLDGCDPGWARTGISHQSRSCQVAGGRVTVTDILESVRRTEPHRLPGLLEENHQLILGIDQWASANSRAISRSSD